MASNEGINKSQAIRDYYKAHPTAKTSEVVDALGRQGIKVSVSLITNVKSKHNKRRQVVKQTVAKGEIGVPEIKAALAFIKSIGSVAAAKKVLDVAQEIRAIV
jgi:6-phosphogluconate dehydrogenase